ncbi:MAG: class I SAM-dependent methyltransferase [Micromonosporaceae bacterium]
MSFLREFVRNPRQTGSIAASSGPVVRMLLDSLDLTAARRVVELGAGTGAVTAGLAERLGPDAALLAVELNPEFAHALRRRFSSPSVRIANRSATELPELLRAQRWGPVDAIASGLPWTLMSDRERRDTLDMVVDVLAPDGQFVTLTCLHQTVTGSGRLLRQLLEERFGQVRRQPVVWAAVPPMFVYRCTQPVKTAPPAVESASATMDPRP